MPFALLANMTFQELAAGNLPLSGRAVWAFSIYGLFGLVGLVIDIWIVFHLLAHPVSWAERISWIQRRPWRWREAVSLLAVLILMMLAVGWMARLVMGTEDPGTPDSGARWVVGQSVAIHWVALLIIAGFVFRRGMTWKKAFGLEWARIGKDVRNGFVLYLATLPVLFFYTLCYELYSRWTGHRPEPQDVVEILFGVQSTGLLVYLVLLATVIAPLVEECIFRGIGLPVLTRSMSLAPAVLLVSAGFAILHGLTVSLVPLFILAVAFSLAYLYTKSLMVPVFMHGLFNGVSLVLLLALRSG